MSCMAAAGSEGSIITSLRKVRDYAGGEQGRSDQPARPGASGEAELGDAGAAAEAEEGEEGDGQTSRRRLR
jgi:hypothetical protein